MRDFKTYIFDLDGTLLSTLNDLASSTNYALRWAGMPERTIEEVRMFVGNGVLTILVCSDGCFVFCHSSFFDSYT